MAFEITIDGFYAGGNIPNRFTCNGENLSPRIRWTGESPETKSFALIVDDPDAPNGTWNHWLVWDIPSGVHSLDEGGSQGREGANDSGGAGYTGPCPPRGHGPHRYYFHIFALDTATLGLHPGAKRRELDAAMRNHVIAKATYMGRYERK